MLENTGECVFGLGSSAAVEDKAIDLALVESPSARRDEGSGSGTR